MTVLTGRVEIGQGILTAMARSPPTSSTSRWTASPSVLATPNKAPDEGYTAGSQSIQFGGVALRLVCAEVRALFLDQAAKVLGCKASELSVGDGSISAQRHGDRPGLLDACRRGRSCSQGDRLPAHAKPSAISRSSAPSSARLDLPAKVFGDAAFIHDMLPDGMVHARVVRQPQPRRRDRFARRERDPPRRQGADRIRARRQFLAFIGDDETAVEAAGAAAVEPCDLAERRGADADCSRRPTGCCSGRRSTASSARRSRPIRKARERFEATYTRGYIAHASISPSCALAEFRDGQLTVWTHCQGVYPLRAALAKALELEPPSIIVHHVQGAGCYGHNGADDAAADAAIIAMQMPGKPIRVQWRREEEFVFEPRRRR